MQGNKKKGSIFYRATTAIPRWAWTHKIKTLFILIMIYASFKIWKFYTAYIKPFLEITKEFRGGSQSKNNLKSIQNSQNSNQKDAQNLEPAEVDDFEYYDEIENENLQISQIIPEKFQNLILSHEGDTFQQMMQKKQQLIDLQNQKQISKSKKCLHYIANSSKDEIFRIKIFQSTINTSRSSLSFQSKHLAQFINEDILNLQKIKDLSTEQNQSPQEKILRWKNFKNCVFVSYFLQIYAIRIANMISLITLVQTGKRYFKNQIYLQNKEKSSESNPLQGLLTGQNPSLMGMIGLQSNNQEADNLWENQKNDILIEMNKYNLEQEIQLLPLNQQDQQAQMIKCEAFSRDVFKQIIKPLISNVIAPKIKSIVENFIEPLKLKQDVNKNQLTVLLQHINHLIRTDFFQRDQEKVRQWEMFMAQDNISNDSLEPQYHNLQVIEVQDDNFQNGDKDVNREPQPWIIEQILLILQRNLENQNEIDILTQCQKQELMDTIEQEYFQSSLFEVLNQTFNICTHQKIFKELFQENEEKEISQDEEPIQSQQFQDQKVKMLLITTLFFKINGSNLNSSSQDYQHSPLLSVLIESFLPCMESQYSQITSLNMMIKQIYFDYFPIPNQQVQGLNQENLQIQSQGFQASSFNKKEVQQNLKNQKMYQKVVLQHLEDFNEMDLKKNSNENSDGGFEQQLLQSLFGSSGMQEGLASLLQNKSGH